MKSILNENFQKIHLDTTIICRNDKKFNLDKIRERFFDLFKSIPHKKLKKNLLSCWLRGSLRWGGSLTVFQLLETLKRIIKFIIL